MSIKDEYLNPLTKRSPRKLRSSVAKIPNYLRHTFSFLLKFHRKKKKKLKHSLDHTLFLQYIVLHISNFIIHLLQDPTLDIHFVRQPETHN